MAAGKGTRLKSRRPKVLHEIGGKPLLAHVIAAASKIVAPADIYVIVGHQAEIVQNAVADTGVQFILQAEQLGTGHAIQCARQQIAGYDDVLVLSGDVPLIRRETIEMLLEYHNLGAAMSILTAFPEDPYGYGRVVRKDDDGGIEIEAIVEQKSLTSDQMTIREINSGIYAFQTKPLLAHLDEMALSDVAKEYYLTDLARIFVAAGERVVAIRAPDAAEVLGANTIPDLVALDATLRSRKALSLMAEGVTIFRPETCMIDSDVVVGPDTIIEPHVQLLGKTRIGSDCLIRSSNVIENSTLADEVIILPNCVIVDSVIHRRAEIGPFSHLRPGCDIGEEAHIGAFVQTKKARFGKGAKAGHLAYLGDADIGERANIGAGVITCNYDSVQKHGTAIGKGAFIGSDSTLVAPISIGDGAYIGAGSCITRDVPADALAVGRSRQVTKEGWASSRRSKQQRS
jgi:bifunctional UDP-N-acetylglucosamine pyrophosphorylase/glucosamine-1-phosphate N-acetyltransferase